MTTSPTSQRVALAVTTSIFFMWGFITVLNDVLIPHLKSVFTLNYTQAMLVQFVFFGAYFVMSLPSGKVVARLGFRSGIVVGLAVTGLGALMFVPAAKWLSYELFLAAFFVLASGITLLQVAANPYVSLLGDPRYASSRLNLAQALNSLGTTIGPKIGGILILSTAVLGATELAALSAEEQTAYRVAQANLVIMPYLVLAGTLFALAAIVRLFHLPPLAQAEGGAASASAQGWRAALAKRQLRGGVIAIFVYVGAEVAIGSLMINFLSLPTVGKMSEAEAAGYVSLYWGGAMVGRFIGFLLLRKIDPGRLLAIFAAIAAAMAATATVTEGSLALWSVVGIGLFNSIMFPTIFTLGIARMGAMTDKASSLLIMGIVGGAIVPVITGVIADRFGEHWGFVPAVLCYLYIVYYGWRGSRVTEGDDTAPASSVVMSGH